MFLGRPAIIVIHHDYLKDRYGALGELIDKINAIDRGIRWSSLEKIIENSYWERTTSDGSIHVELYACRAKIKNTSGRKLKCMISKAENQNVPISEVKVNGVAVRYQVNGCRLVLTRDMDANEAIDFAIIYQDYGPSGVKKEGIIQSQKTRFRRYLSEVRDNILCKNDFLLTTANRIKRLVP